MRVAFLTQTSTKLMMLIRSVLLLLCASIGANAWAADVAGPQEVLTNATEGMIAELKALSIEERTDPVVHGLVQTYIIPAIDQEKIAKGILKKYWRLADKAQQQEFITRFTELQVRTYGGAFKAFSGETLEFKEPRINDKGNKALVKGELTQTNGNVIPVDFLMYKSKKDGQWRIVDAVVSGLKMVNTYHDQMTERLSGTNPSNAKERIDQLLAELSQEAEAAAQASAE